MRLKQDTRILKRKSLSSFRHAMTHFNSPNDDGRVAVVLLATQHAFEMLLKGALVQRNFEVFDRVLGRSLGLEKCIRAALNDKTIKLTEEEAGTIRAIDAMRDDEQHWYNIVPEQILYLHARAAVTLFDDLLRRLFSETLADHLPSRVLPISLDPPQDLLSLVDKEYSQIKKLLAPGRRATYEAHARIRTLLALEAHVDAEARVSTKDVRRVARGVKNGATWEQVFPRLLRIGTDISGQGVSVMVRFSKTEGMPVRYVKGDAEAENDVAAIREFDLQKRFHVAAAELAKRLGLTQPRCKALRDHLGIDRNETCCHVFEFGSQKHPRFSDKAVVEMKRSLESLDMNAIWEVHRPGSGARSTPLCSQPGCSSLPT